MDHRDKSHGMNIALLLTFLVFDPVGYSLTAIDGPAGAIRTGYRHHEGKNRAGFSLFKRRRRRGRKNCA